MDFNLQPLLRAENPEQQKLLMERLFSTQIEPLVKQTIRVKFRSVPTAKNDEDDVFSETLLKLWKQLQKWVQSPEQMEVRDFSAYVATTTVNCCKEYFRSKVPRRWHLRNRLRYLLSHSRDFAIWQSKTGEWVTGFSDWKDRDPVKAADLAKSTQQFQRASGKLFEIVRQVFRQSSGPLTLDDLLAIVIAYPGIREQFQDLQMQADERVDSLADPRSHLETRQRPYLERLWLEICGLPSKQRVALLLNLRDREGRDAIAAFPSTGIATIAQIAIALEMAKEELAELWNDLPLDDARIADRLQLTRQQVINLRKSARERLTNRMKKVTS